ncbi:MAG: hypothetical protein JO307_00525 [Bryobacterales bacterium]|nr:hypothetical protein [Bryobacterales bacterium]MBV9397999.1 hypothetical protein [Bryobacterales bacterium]
MRTTLTLEDDIAEQLTDLARESRKGFKAVVNETLRRGLGGAVRREPKFILKPHAGNLRPGIDDRRLNDLIWEMDEERLTRKHTSGKS